jgi:hypothetical protein
MASIQCCENGVDANFGDFEIFDAGKSTDRDRANTLLSIKNRGTTVPAEISGVAVIMNVPTLRERGTPQSAAGLTEARRCEHLVGRYSSRRQRGAVHTQKCDQLAMPVTDGDGAHFFSPPKFGSAGLNRETRFCLTKFEM